MKILILLSASLFGFGLMCKETASLPKPASTTISYNAYEEPVATIALDTIEVVYVTPPALAGVDR
ncbi:hypothetical protein JAO76_01175 [Pontibacter sp. BT310]|uniref:Uncharacterized protein n=1 Tax=Pontibacter populi TaxID=890055 RepID=A0ABS6X8Y9_9BACT|nr:MULTISPECIES: hypothetical protein [Pontibacter]MBJ6116782.1 hypothetical protein [Pontibacter sp. BT310]MBR0569204.1 hypothetical protein [Microvirga sp. STS03]MBW3363635.1 hypothetical protein [Pontibacter populi]